MLYYAITRCFLLPGECSPLLYDTKHVRSAPLRSTPLHKAINISALRALRQHFAASLGDEQCVFKLSRALAVHGDTGPLVGPQHIFPRALI